MKELLESLQKLVPWAAGLPLPPKILLTLIVFSVAALFIMLIWMPSPRQTNMLDVRTNKNVSSRDSGNLRIVDLVVDKPRSLNPVLDIKLLNSGSTTVFLTRLAVIVLQRVPYAAYVKPSAKYDLLIDSERNEMNVAHEIQPNGTDRIIVKLGAARHNLACYFKFQVELTYNGDNILLSEPFEVEFVKD